MEKGACSLPFASKIGCFGNYRLVNAILANLARFVQLETVDERTLFPAAKIRGGAVTEV